jgi:hypothetical protein
MTGTNCDLFTHNQSLSYLNHLVDSQEKAFRLRGSGVSRRSLTTRDPSLIQGQITWDS